MNVENKDRRFNNATSAKQQLIKDFNDWCEIFTSHSLQTAFALIAANWAVHGTSRTILNNTWAKWSIISILLFLAINLIIDYIMTTEHNKRYRHADDDPVRWEREYKENATDKIWPYSPCIEYSGKFLRILKLLCPVISSIFFIISVIDC